MCMKLFQPWLEIPAVEALSPHFCKDHHIKLVLLDRDNTIYNQGTNEISPAIKRWSRTMQDAGIHLAIVSNNTHKEELIHDAHMLNVELFAPAYKPLPFVIKRACKHFASVPHETILVGDQIMTDCIAARLAKVYPVIVPPLSTRDYWWTRVLRTLGRVMKKEPERKLP